MNRPAFTILILLIGLSIESKSQTGIPLDSAQAALYQIQGDSLMEAHLYEQAKPIFELAGSFYEKTENWNQYLNAHNQLARALLELDDLDLAEEKLQALIQINQEKLGALNRQLGISFNNAAQIFSYRFEYDTALILYEKSINVLLQTPGDSRSLLANTYLKLGEMYQRIGQKANSIKYMKKSLIIHEEIYEKHASIGTSHNNLGYVYSYFGDYDSAGLHFEAALNIKLDLLEPNDIRLVSSFNNMGFIKEKMGVYSEALEYHERSMKVLEQYPQSHRYRPVIISNIGVIFERLNQYEKALEYYENALNWAKTNSVDPVYISDGHMNVGNVLLKQDRFHLALEQHQIAKELLLNSVGESHARTAMAYHNIGATYLDLDDFENAEKHLQTSLRLRRKNLGQEHPDVSESLYSLGLLYYKKEIWDRALTHLKGAQALDTKHFGRNHPYVIESNNDIARVYLAMNQFDSALSRVNDAIELNVADLNQSANDLFEAAITREDLLNSYELKAAIQQKFLSPDIKNLQSRLTTLQTADSIVQASRYSFVRLNDKVNFMVTAQRIYGEAVSTSLAIFDQTKEQNHLSMAYEFVEKSKASALLDNRIQSSARQQIRIPSELRDFENTLRFNASYYQSRINELRDDDITVTELFKTKLFNTMKSLDSLEAVFEASIPNYKTFKYSNQLVSKDHIQKSLTPNTAILEYFDQDSLWHLFIITKEKTEHLSFKKSNDLESLLGQWESAHKEINMGHVNFSEYKSGAHGLYQILLEKGLAQLPERITNLIIIPMENIAMFPLETLITSENGGDFKSLDYLAKNYVVSYAFSANTLFQQFNKTESTTEEILAFAPEYTQELSPKTLSNLRGIFRGQVTPLKWNKSEAKAATTALQGKLVVGNDATEETFKKEASKYQVLHLAMHALVDYEESMDSKLVFTQNNDSIEDGMLHAFEIFNMRLNAELAVLSACNTGVGEVQAGEGVMSLARAFAYAGVPSLVMSHWNVNDESTAKLMTSFYQYLAEGYRKDEALRKAKLDFLDEANEIQTNPFYWAGFVLVGDTQPINENRNYWWWLLLLIPAIGVIRRVRNK